MARNDRPFSALNHQHLPAVMMLIENGADLAIPDKEGKAALHIACKVGFTKVTEASPLLRASDSGP